MKDRKLIDLRQSFTLQETADLLTWIMEEPISVTDVLEIYRSGRLDLKFQPDNHWIQEVTPFCFFDNVAKTFHSGVCFRENSDKSPERACEKLTVFQISFPTTNKVEGVPDLPHSDSPEKAIAASDLTAELRTELIYLFKQDFLDRIDVDLLKFKNPDLIVMDGAGKYYQVLIDRFGLDGSHYFDANHLGVSTTNILVDGPQIRNLVESVRLTGRESTGARDIALNDDSARAALDIAELNREKTKLTREIEQLRNGSLSTEQEENPATSAASDWRQQIRDAATQWCNDRTKEGKPKPTKSAIAKEMEVFCRNQDIKTDTGINPSWEYIRKHILNTWSPP